MRILIIQPPDFENDFTEISINREHIHPFSPPWDVLCLEQYFRSRTRHEVEFLDMRIFSSTEEDLKQAIAARENVELVAIYCDTDGIGFAAGVVELLQRHHPTLKKLVFGPFPTAFPKNVLTIPDVDFAIAGDPERSLQLLADNIDVPARWLHIPGLIFAGQPATNAHFHPDLSQRELPSFTQTFWAAYKRNASPRGARITARLSSGHTGLPCDKLHEPIGQSLRIHDLHKMANCIQSATHAEIDTIHFTDPPGLWSPTILTNFSNALIRARNAQPWSFCMLPAFLSDDVVESLSQSHCREITFLLPTPKKDALATFGCVVDPQAFAGVRAQLEALDIRTTLHFLIGGPHSTPQEGKQILHWLQQLQYPSYGVTPFPMPIASPLYRETYQPVEAKHLKLRLSWARAPWIEKRPVPIWGGADSIDDLSRVIKQIRSQSKGGLLSKSSRWIKRLAPTNMIRGIEDWAIGLLVKRHPEE